MTKQIIELGSQHFALIACAPADRRLQIISCASTDERFREVGEEA